MVLWRPKIEVEFSEMAGDEGVNKDYNLYMSENGHLSFQNPNYHQR